VADGRPHQRIIDILALTMGLQVNAWFSPEHNTPARQLAVLDDLLTGVRGLGAT
jgi:hypothetical protein